MIEKAKKELDLQHETVLSAFKVTSFPKSQWIVLLKNRVVLLYYPEIESKYGSGRRDSFVRHRIEIPYVKITGVSASKGFLSSSIRVFEGTREHHIKSVSKGEAPLIVQSIQNMLRQPEPTVTVTDEKRFCSQCGKPVESSDAKFCLYCGASL